MVYLLGAGGAWGLPRPPEDHPAAARTAVHRCLSTLTHVPSLPSPPFTPFLWPGHTAPQKPCPHTLAPGRGGSKQLVPGVPVPELFSRPDPKEEAEAQRGGVTCSYTQRAAELSLKLTPLFSAS